MDALKAITAAIGVGVPLFNAGDAGGCAAVYADCAASLLSGGGLPVVARERLAVDLARDDDIRVRLRERAPVLLVEVAPAQLEG